LNVAVATDDLANGVPVGHDWDAYTVADKDGARRLELAVDGITCAACLTDIERGLRRLPGVLNWPASTSPAIASPSPTIRSRSSRRASPARWRRSAIAPIPINSVRSKPTNRRGSTC